MGAILRDLPEWFGIEDAITSYVEHAGQQPSYLATQGEQVVGVVLVARHFSASAEVSLMAVAPTHHRQGIGTQLLGFVEEHLRADGVKYLQVHTVGPSYDDAAYAQTRQFYVACGFAPLQEFVALEWDGPTLVMVKAIT